MSGCRRNIIDLDYAELHRTGNKVPKSRKHSMANPDLFLQAVNITSDVEDLLDSYELDELIEGGELNEYVTKLGNLKKGFRRVHSQIKSLGEEDFKTDYSHYGELLDKLNKEFKTANTKLKTKVRAELEAEKIREEIMAIKKGSEENVRAELEAEKLREEIMAIKRGSEGKRAQILSEWQLCVDQMRWERDGNQWELFSDVKNVQGKIYIFESRLDKFYKICGEIKGVFNDEAKTLGYDEINTDLITSVRVHICTGNARITELKEESNLLLEAKLEKEAQMLDQEERARVMQEQMKKKEKIQNLLDCAANLKFEIEARYAALKNKFDIVFSDLSDYEVLDLKKREDNISVELREILDKMSSFLLFVSPCGTAASTMCNEIFHFRDGISECAISFSKNLKKVIVDRDISEKKLRNTGGLKIKMRIFQGYQSEINIFTFRSEFKKLVEPEVQKVLWVDYLKENCLTGAAYNMVSSIEEIGSIWSKLFEVYGNTQLMLQDKISSLEKFSNLDQIKDDEKIAYHLSSILNVMSELSSLAKEYDLEGELYHGGGIHKILSIIGRSRERSFIWSVSEETLKNPQKWDRLVKFLKKELIAREAYILNEKSKQTMNLDNKVKRNKVDQKVSGAGINQVEIKSFISQSDDKTKNDINCVCHICGKNDYHVKSFHTDGKPFIEYVACKSFVEMTPRERSKVLFNKKLCAKCLKPGIIWNDKHNCDLRYCCSHKYRKYNKELSCQKHVLVCNFHSSEDNNNLLECYKKNMSKLNNNFKEFSKAISIGCFVETYHEDRPKAKEENSIYAFQTISIGGLLINLFFDSGCGDLVIRKVCCDKLKSLGRAQLESPGPIVLHGVGNQKSICEYGSYSVKLPLNDIENAWMCGICVDDITIPFPVYHLGTVEQDFHNQVSKIDIDMVNKLPRLPRTVGGVVDIMIGKQYLKYFPKEIIRLKSGLSLYRSQFMSPDGTTGVISGPHSEFSKVDRVAQFARGSSPHLFSQTVKDYNDNCKLSENIPLLGFKLPHELNSLHGDVCSSLERGMGVDTVFVTRGPRNFKHFEKLEDSGTSTPYRCVDCRSCLDCKNGPITEEISIKDEVEQSLIEKSVALDVVNKVCNAKLPFISNPENTIGPTLSIAMKVYKGQIKALSKSPGDKKAVIDFEGKLQDFGYVDWVENLNEEDKKFICNSPIQYFIPWRIAWSNSISTPTRMVFDASQRPSGTCSLNDILPKGVNSINSLVEILIRWTIKHWAFHSDIRKMYNAVQLEREYWCYQLYLWDKELDQDKVPEWKVIQTLIYGVRSSGSQAEKAIRLTSSKYRDQYPVAHDIVNNDTYVDDIISGAKSESEMFSASDELILSLEKGGFALKGFSFSGQDPDVKLSADKKSVNVGGVKWFTKEDYIMLNAGEMNFSKKVRGRKRESEYDIPEKLTVRHCVGKVAEIFDLLGRVAPLIAGMKVDISYLLRSNLSWDDQIPESIRAIWESNFAMIQEIGGIRYKRAIVPPNAKNLDIVTIDTGDASEKLICVAIYARFERTDGSFSCQLVFARSKIVPEGTSIPRAELIAANMNAATGHTVKRAFGDYHKKAFKITDSMVVLHWITSNRIVLKTWVRNRINEINRLVKSSSWRYVESKNMVADLGTRKGAKVCDIVEGSAWINGLPWMSGPESEFPMFSLEQLKFCQNDVVECEKEKFALGLSNIFLSESLYSHRNMNDKEIRARYQFSQYLIDPNRLRFRNVIRILALVFSFIKRYFKNVQKVQNLKIFSHDYPGKLSRIVESKGDKYILTTALMKSTCQSGQVIELSDQMLESAMYYFFRKSTEELKQFVDKKKYKNISREVDGIVYFVGRIPSDLTFDGYPELNQAAIDLSSTSFVVPVMDEWSPVAISIAMEIHWYHPDVQHHGLEVILRQTQSVTHIIGGRNLAKSIKRSCIKCKIMDKRSIDVVMGQVQDVNLCIAPAFFASQVDIFGPFKSYSIVNKRATIKVWFVIFCCCTTGGIDIRLLEDYSTDAFVQGFVRFACRFGYPKYLLPDPGSQLVKGCESMRYSFSDTKQKLSFEYDVNYSVSPVGAHYTHGKVERKIREIKKCVRIKVENERLSVMQWETLMQQISNSINNLPIGLRNKCENLEQLDIITPNRLMLGRNNDRCPNSPLVICPDYKKLLENNATIFRAWFKGWMVCCVPSLMERPKWHKSDKQMNVGDVVLFLKSEREYDEQYQYGIVKSIYKGKDEVIRKVDVEYQNHNESVKRITKRGVRDLVIVHAIDDLDIYEKLNKFNQ